MANAISAVVAVFNETSGSKGASVSSAGMGYLRAVVRAGNSPRSAKLNKSHLAARAELRGLGLIDSDGWVTPAGRRLVLK